MKKKITILTSSIALFTVLSGSVLAAGLDKDIPQTTILGNYQLLESPEVANLKTQVSLLEDALAPENAKAAADHWAKAISNRNGAYQYALFTKELKKSTKTYFEQNGWVTEGSSPWVKSFKLQKEKKLNSNVYQYTFEFSLASSTGAAGKESATINVKQVNKKWYIEKIAIKPGSTLGFRTPYVQERTFNYRAAEYSFSIPVSWDTKYTVTEQSGNLVFKYKPKNSLVSARPLFSIDKISEKVWEKDGFAEGLYKKLGEQDGFIYAMLPSSENQYAEHPNTVEYNDFNQMSQQLNMVINTFQIGHQ
jgi:hypothetical protein